MEKCSVTESYKLAIVQGKTFAVASDCVLVASSFANGVDKLEVVKGKVIGVGFNVHNSVVSHIVGQNDWASTRSAEDNVAAANSNVLLVSTTFDFNGCLGTISWQGIDGMLDL